MLIFAAGFSIAAALRPYQATARWHGCRPRNIEKSCVDRLVMLVSNEVAVRPYDQDSADTGHRAVMADRREHAANVLPFRFVSVLNWSAPRKPAKTVLKISAALGNT